MAQRYVLLSLPLNSHYSILRYPLYDVYDVSNPHLPQPNLFEQKRSEEEGSQLRAYDATKRRGEHAGRG